MYFVLPYTSHTFFQVCCLSLSLFQSTVVRFPNGIAKVRLFSFIPNPNQKFLHFFWNYFSPQQPPQRNSLKNSTLSQISAEGIFFVNFYFLNNFVTKRVRTNANHNKCGLQAVQTKQAVHTKQAVQTNQAVRRCSVRRKPPRRAQADRDKRLGRHCNLCHGVWQ